MNPYQSIGSMLTTNHGSEKTINQQSPFLNLNNSNKNSSLVNDVSKYQYNTNFERAKSEFATSDFMHAGSLNYTAQN